MKRTVSLGLVAALLVPALSAAQSSAPGGLRGLLRVRSADIQGRGILEGGFFVHGHSLLDDANRRHYFSVMDFQVAYGVSPYLEAGLDMPVRGWWVGDAGGIEPRRMLGFGDLLASGKLQLPLPTERLRLGALVQVSVPTGSRSRGMSSESTDVEAGGALTVDLSHLQRFVPTRVHLNASYRWNRNETRGVGMARLDSLRDGGFWPPAYPPVPPGGVEADNDQLLLRAGVEFSTRPVDLFTEFSVDMFPKSTRLQFSDLPSFITQGALVKLRNGLNVKLGVDVTLQKEEPAPQVPKVPDWRLHLGVTWRVGLTLGDDDQDGVPNDSDECPDDREDYDGYADEDGCPDVDNDGDGVPDVRDLAPDLPEDMDGFEDEDGRPDMDNDGDGIPDDQDQCPNEAEDFDGDRDLDGCPDLQRDRDGDGVQDDVDRCPDTPEDVDGVEDEDGCPEADAGPESGPEAPEPGSAASGGRILRPGRVGR